MIAGLLSALFLAAAPPVAVPPQTRPPPIVMAPPAPTPWPPILNIRPLTPPDVSDASNYPQEAERRMQEGLVVFELLVARNGMPRACRIYRSSGFPSLDDGTCALGMRLRFAPPRNETGANVEATFHGQILWKLPAEAAALVPSMIVAALTIRGGRFVSCETSGYGPLFVEWRRTACLMIASERKYYLGDREPAAGRADVIVALYPTGGGAAAPGDPRPGPPTAWQRLDFDLKRNGDIKHCRTVRAGGFGTMRVDGHYRCGNFFLSQASFDRAPRGAPTRTGAIEIRVHLSEEEERVQ